ncbi:hypothetical protein THAOC_04412 [Thalassiosira oceanica]|uniref:Uncharacterized protein n=1 Tax=Thalassiosira oceanica TaxID=159749 RepID=K0T597_THAOC|nr:hypothetical protein THAOC_04412 [Thalassiosira oceanica]|eukprot:EJK73943.1 hypothetical protein THAOC_04412 [Thalassiosira oceanica]
MNQRKTEHARTIRTEVLWSARPVDDDGLPIVAFAKRNRGTLGVLLLLLSLKMLSAIMATVAPMAMNMNSEPQKLVFVDYLEKPNVIEPITEVRLDGRLKRLADVEDRRRVGDVPLFFHMPRSMGGTYREILKCVGIERTLGSSLDEIKNGKQNSAVKNGVDAFESQRKHISLEMWARSRRVESNRLTRFLSNQLEGELTQNHLNTAKEVLRRKCIVGLFEEKVDSWQRFQRYFSMKLQSKDTECIDRYLSYDWKNKRLHPTVEEGSTVWNLLFSQNEFDMEMYHYALSLFEQQKGLA